VETGRKGGSMRTEVIIKALQTILSNRIGKEVKVHVGA
jgi:hypothetical protein